MYKRYRLIKLTMAFNAKSGASTRSALRLALSSIPTGGMGRPPLGMKPTTIRLPIETLQRIEALVGNRRIALFIREAVENELRRRGESTDEGEQGDGV